MVDAERDLLARDVDAFARFVIVAFGQLLGMCAWYSMVQLGSLSEVSAFSPLIALDVFVPVLLGIFILGERVTSLGYVGMALSAVGVALISTST